MTGLGYSIRRRFLDRDLDRVAAARMTGQVLEVGSGRAGRRGRFRPPVRGVTRWLHLDRDLTRRPHVGADVGDLPFPAHAFDTVVCLEVLEYVWRPGAALAEVARVLRPGGTLVLATPFLHRADAPDDLFRYTEPALRRLLGDAGFRVESCRAQGGPLAVAVSIVRFVIGARRSMTRRVLAAVLLPVFELALWVDASMVQANGSFGFTTGFLVVASRSEQPV